MHATYAIYPYPASAINLVVPANSGSNYQFINIYNAGDSTGTYNYSTTNSLTATLNLNDSVDGADDISLSFSTLNMGNYIVTNNVAPQAYTTGNFNFFSGNALSSIIGKTIIFNVSDGAAPFASSGSLTIYTATSGNTYKTDNPGQSGTYSYSLVNKSTGKLTNQ